ncbi:hypothetical protein KJ763_00640 [Patescibacteria group bacterium]|nr:hypothetical protein [Patescibacteria group bacterium]
MSADQLISKITSTIVNPLIGLMIAIAFMIFIWGVVQFIANADNQQKRDEGKKHILWGLVGLLIMISVGGIIQVIASFLNSL